MKSRIPLLLMLVVFAAVASPARAESVVGFRYQGSLNDGASPATGSYDLSFALCDASSNGIVIGSLTNSGTVVSNGLFSAALAFPTSFNGTNYWLEIAARTNGNGPFTTLSPRQQLMPVPQAIYAIHAGTATTAMTASNANSVSAANLVGTLSTAQLPANVALLNAANTFSGNQTVSGAVGIGVAASPSTVLHVVSPNPNARVLFESSVPNGNPALIVKANSPAGEADIVADRADTGASAALNLLMGGTMEWTLRTPNFTSGEPTRLDLGNAASTPVMTFRQNGNVGIGRTSPATTLDVNGTVTATGFSGNFSGGTNLPLTGLQSGGAANAQILTWNGSRWSPSNAPAGGAGGLAITATNLSAATSQSLLVAAGNGTGNGGQLTLNAGNAGIPSGGAGGNLNLLAGNSMPSGGSGYGGLGAAGSVNISAGNGYNNVGGDVLVQSGGNSPWTLAPNSFSKVSLQGGTINAGDGAVIDVEGGHNSQYGSPPAYSAGGNVKITAGNATGAYTGGNIILTPGTGSPSGNVGIGKPNPATALDVNGTVTATGFSGNFSGGTNLPLTGLQSGGAANAQILTWNGSRWSPSNAPAGGASGLAITATNLSAATSQSLLVAAGNGTGNGGNLSLNAGDAGVTSGGAGGNLNLQSGSAVPQGGSGYSGQGPAGIVNISAGGGYNGVGGNVIVKSGPNSPWSLTPNGYSKVSLQGGTLNAGDGAVIDVEGGHNPLSNGSGVSAGGNVKITAGNAAGAYSGGHILLMPGTGSPGGNVGIGKTSPATALDVNGTVTATAFSPSSDRNLKENFAPVSPRDVLDKVAAMPISRWNFIGDAATPHFGPMAQDFHAAFGLGTDERHIATVDADGVALAAIQGLNQKLNEKDAEIQDLKRSIADLKKLVRALVEKK